MSADAISKCPICGAQEMREWYEFYSDAEDSEDKPTSVTAEYSSHCRACDYEDKFKYTHQYHQ